MGIPVSVPELVFRNYRFHHLQGVLEFFMQNVDFLIFYDVFLLVEVMRSDRDLQLIALAKFL